MFTAFVGDLVARRSIQRLREHLIRAVPTLCISNDQDGSKHDSLDVMGDPGQLSLIGLESGVTLDGIEQVVTPTVPYEVLARGPAAVEAFYRALSEGEARVSRMQLAVIGAIGAGKSSLVRTLTGEEFVEERRETHGIDRSMVEMTELDSSWNVVDLDKSHVDDILADKVCEDIRCFQMAQEEDVSQPQDITIYSYGFPPRESPSTFSGRCSRADAAGSDEVEDSNNCQNAGLIEGEQRGNKVLKRQMPVGKIADCLSREPSDEEENKLYAKISIWDFAGHPLYETMHHIFLNSRSFYLVVFSLEELVKEEMGTLNTIRFWLNSVRVHTPTTTPVFLVGTHRDQVQDEDVSRAEKATYDSFAEAFGQQLVYRKEGCYLFTVDNTQGGNDDGTAALRKAIEEEARRLEHVEEKLPIRWLHFEEELFKLQASHEHCMLQEDGKVSRCVTRDHLQAMANEKCGATPTEEFHSMIQFFHDSGVVILPEALVGPSTQDHQELVVLDPQYLVDVMTSLHDIEKHMEENRQYRSHWNTLKQGFATMELLKFAWRDFENPVNDLLGILEAAGLLCPVQGAVKASVRSEENFHKCSLHSNDHNTDPDEPNARTFVVPLHLAEKDLHGKWLQNCRKWKGICATDKVLIFDFQNFLPPALFYYLLVRTSAESERTNGMQPIMARDMGIFSFGDRFFLLLKRIVEHNQVQVNIRHKHRDNLHDVYVTLKSIVTGICDQYFRYLKINLGPPCPNPSCPGASVDGKVLKAESSSEDSEEQEEDWNVIKNGRRQHVISIDPSGPPVPLWCNTDTVHEFEEIRQWFPSQDGDSAIVEEQQVSAKPTTNLVESCCLVVITKELSPNWKMVGRYLKIDESTIKNITADNRDNQLEQAYQLLNTWRAAKGPAATQEALTEALLATDRRDVAETLKKHLEGTHQAQM